MSRHEKREDVIIKRVNSEKAVWFSIVKVWFWSILARLLVDESFEKGVVRPILIPLGSLSGSFSQKTSISSVNSIVAGMMPVCVTY